MIVECLCLSLCQTCNLQCALPKLCCTRETLQQAVSQCRVHWLLVHPSRVQLEGKSSADGKSSPGNSLSGKVVPTRTQSEEHPGHTHCAGKLMQHRPPTKRDEVTRDCTGTCRWPSQPRFSRADNYYQTVTKKLDKIRHHIFIVNFFKIPELFHLVLITS
jgi:hypothetical protein